MTAFSLTHLFLVCLYPILLWIFPFHIQSPAFWIQLSTKQPSNKKKKRTGEKKNRGAVLSIFAFAHGLIFILRIADMIRLDLGARMVLGWFFRWVVALSSFLLECKNKTAWDGKIDGNKSNHPNINGCHVSFDVAQSKETCPADRYSQHSWDAGFACIRLLERMFLFAIHRWDRNSPMFLH